MELGPDGKEWAKTKAAFGHVENVMPQAITGPEGLVWYGHIVREAFVAGAEWQETRLSQALSDAHSAGMREGVAALDAAGFVVVPKEPDDAMIAAGVASLRDNAGFMAIDRDPLFVWRDMLLARPRAAAIRSLQPTLDQPKDAP